MMTLLTRETRDAILAHESERQLRAVTTAVAACSRLRLDLVEVYAAAVRMCRSTPALVLYAAAQHDRIRELEAQLEELRGEVEP